MNVFNLQQMSLMRQSSQICFPVEVRIDSKTNIIIALMSNSPLSLINLIEKMKLIHSEFGRDAASDSFI